MYKVIVKGRKQAKGYYTEILYFETRENARNYIKEQKTEDSAVYNRNGLYYNYKIVKM